MPSIAQFPQVNIVETFLERGGVLKLSHGPIFSDFTNKSPVCVRQSIQQSKPRHEATDLSLFQKDSAEHSLQKQERQSSIPKDPQCDTQYLHKKPQEHPKTNNSVKYMGTDTDCKAESQAKGQDPRNPNQKTSFTSENRSERRPRRQRRKPNGVVQVKENSRSQRSRERPPMEAKGTNTEVMPFFTLDPSWPCLMDTSVCKKSKTPMTKATPPSLLQPASSSMVPKAHTQPNVYKTHRPNSNSEQAQRGSDHDSELLKKVQRDVFEIKEEICKTNSLVKVLEKQMKEASSSRSHDAADKKANQQTSLLNMSGTRWIEPVLPPCASPMQTRSLPLFPGMDLLQLSIGESSVVSQSFQQNAYQFVQEPSLSLPSLDLSNHDTGKERTSSKISTQSRTSTPIESNPRLTAAYHNDALPRDMQNDKALTTKQECLNEDMNLFLHGENSAVSLTELINEKRETLRDLTKKKGMCAIELKYLTKLKQAKHQFLKEFNNQEDSALQENILSKAEPSKPSSKRKAIPQSKTKSTTPADDKDTTDGSVICLGLSETRKQKKEAIPEKANNEKDEPRITQKSIEDAKSHREDVAPRTPTDDTERCKVPQENTTIITEHTQSKETTLNSPVEAPSTELKSDTILETGSFTTVNECDLSDSKRNDLASQAPNDVKSEESDADNLLLRVSDLSSNSSVEDDIGQLSLEQSETKNKQPPSISSEASISQEDTSEPDQSMLMPQEVDTQVERSIDGSSIALSISDEAAQIPVDVVEKTEQSTSLIAEYIEIAKQEMKNDLSTANALSNNRFPVTPIESLKEEELLSQAVHEESSLTIADSMTTGNTQKLVPEQVEISQQREDCMSEVNPDQEQSELNLDLQDQDSNESQAEVHEKEEARSHHGGQNIEDINGESISEGVLLYEDTSSASSVVSETGINFCSSVSSSSEPSVEVFKEHEQDPPVQRTFVLESTDSLNSTEDPDTTPTNQNKELHEMEQGFVVARKPMLEEPVFRDLSEDDSEFEHEENITTGDEQIASPSLTSTTFKDEATALPKVTKGSSITEGIDEMVGSCLTKFCKSGDMERFFSDPTQDPYCDLPVKEMHLPAGVLFAGHPPKGIEQMLQDQINTYLLKNRKQIHLANKVIAELNVPSIEELKMKVTKSVHELLQMQELQMEQINTHTIEDLESFFNDDLKFHDLLVRHLS